MRTLSFNKTGDPKEVLELMETEIPIPGDNEALIKVLGSPIHPADYFFIDGIYRYKPEFPQTAGLEGAGVIESVGKNVSLQKGTLVAFDVRGTWSEYAIGSDRSIIPLPANFPIDKAAQFYLNPFTAWGLLEESGAKAGDWLLLTAANSTVSRLVVQLAQFREIKVIAAVRNLTQAEELKKIGADVVLNAEDELFAQQVKEITSGKGVNATLDAVGGETGTKILQSMASVGRVILYGLLSKAPVLYYNADIIFKNLEIKGFGVRGFLQKQNKAQRTKMINTLIEEMAKPSFELPVSQSFSLEQFKEAFTADKQPNKKGKNIFKI